MILLGVINIIAAVANFICVGVNITREGRLAMMSFNAFVGAFSLIVGIWLLTQ